MEAKEYLLHQILGLSWVAEYAASDRKHKRMIAAKQLKKRLFLPLLYPLQKLFIGRDRVRHSL
jgi:hypothetical protein